MKSKIQFDLSATGLDLQVSVRLDDQEIWTGEPATDEKTVEIEFDDGKEQEHALEIEMRNKLPEHTKITDLGEILEDRVVKIRNIFIDDIELGYAFTNLAEYHHDHNGAGPTVMDKFYGDMGCNGVVRLRFSSPVYLWLLENM